MRNLRTCSMMEQEATRICSLLCASLRPACAHDYFAIFCDFLNIFLNFWRFFGPYIWSAGTNWPFRGAPSPHPGTNGTKPCGYKPARGERTFEGICRGPTTHIKRRAHMSSAPTPPFHPPTRACLSLACRHAGCHLRRLPTPRPSLLLNSI